MTLLINTDEAAQVLDMASCMEVLEEAFKEEGQNAAAGHPKSNIHLPTRDPEYWYRYCSMEGGIRKLGVVAIRIKSDVVSHPVLYERERMLWHCIEPGTFCGLILLFSAENGELLAILNDGYIQHLRVGATCGLAARAMAREGARILGVLGSGGLAETHIEALVIGRALTSIRVFSPNEEHRREFAARMERKVEVPVVAVGNPRGAVEGADLVAACTDATGPLVQREWLGEGVFLTSVTGLELDRACYDRVERFIFYQSATAEHYYTTPPDWRPPTEGVVNWTVDRKRRQAYLFGEPFGRLPTYSLPELLLGQVPAFRPGRELNLFMSEGTGVQFAASALRVYQEAKKRGLGRELPVEWFTQKVRN